MATTADVPEDDEAWLYGESDKKDGKPEEEAAGSTLSADAPPFEPAPAASKMEEDMNEDKEAGEVSGEDVENQDDDDEDSDEDDVQVTIGDIKTQPTTYEKFKSGYTRSGQAKQTSTKGVDLETPGLINDQSVYEYDLNILNVDDRPWRKPGADITDYFNYGFTEDTWMKYCEKQKYLRQENGVGKAYIHSVPSVSRGPAPITKTVDPPPQSPTYRPAPTPTPTTPPSTAATTLDQNALLRLGPAGPPPGRKMSGTIDVIGGTRNDSRRPKNQYEYENQNPNDSTTDYTKKWPPTHGPPTDLPPPHIPPPGYGPPPPMSVPPPGPVPPPHMGGPPMGVPPPGMPRFSPGGPPPNYRDGYYPPPSGPPPPDRGPPPGYDNRGPYGYDNYNAPPPGYGAPPPAQPGAWDSRGAHSYNDWEYRRDRSPARSESEFSSSGEEYGDRRYRGRDMYDPFERDLNYERTRQGRPRSRERERSERSDRGSDRDRGDREDRSRDRERRHRDRSERERSDREKDDRHRRSSSRKEAPEGEHRSSKHKKSKRSKRDREDEAMETSQPAATSSS